MIRHILKGDLQKCFWDKVEFIPFHECWEWAAAKNEKGYGIFGVGKETDKAPRISYRLLIGEIPKGLFVLHSCDNPGCVNPQHLRLGTNLDNVRDMLSKKRNSRPPNMAGWNRKQIDEKLISLLGVKPDSQIAKLAGCSRTVIYRLRRDRNIPALESQTRFKTGMPHPRWSKRKGGSICPQQKR